MNTERLKKLLKTHVLSITINGNDTFYYSSADAVDVAIEDLPKLIEVYELYGDDGVLAFIAKIRKEAPLTPLLTDEYYRAKTFLQNYCFFEDLELNSTEWDTRIEYLKRLDWL